MGKMTYWIYNFESEENASNPPRVRGKCFGPPSGPKKMLRPPLGSEENASDPPRVRRKSVKFPKKYGKNDVLDLYFRIRRKCFGPPSGPKKNASDPLGSEEKCFGPLGSEENA